MRKYSLFIGLLVLSVCLSLIAISGILPRTNLGFDYLGAIIGVISVMIAVLIGWNIYTVVDFNEKAKTLTEVRNEIKKFEETSEIQQHESWYGIFSALVYQNIRSTTKDSVQWQTIYWGCCAIEHAYKANCLEDMKYMIGNIKNNMKATDFSVDKEDKDKCLAILYNIPKDYDVTDIISVINQIDIKKE